MSKQIVLPAFSIRSLAALNYPNNSSNGSWTVDDCLTCIRWLEEEIFRVLPPKKREELSTKRGWDAVAISYLEKLHIKVDPKCLAQDAGMARCMPMIICRAVEENMADSLGDMDVFDKDDINPNEPSADPDSVFVDNDCSSFIQTVLGRNDLPTPSIADAIKVLHSRFGPADTEEVQSPGLVGSSFPRVCRLCATESLVQEQERANVILADFQRITANPVTDNKKGRVGV